MALLFRRSRRATALRGMNVLALPGVALLVFAFLRAGLGELLPSGVLAAGVVYAAQCGSARLACTAALVGFGLELNSLTRAVAAESQTLGWLLAELAVDAWFVVVIWVIVVGVRHPLNWRVSIATRWVESARQTLGQWSWVLVLLLSGLSGFTCIGDLAIAVGSPSGHAVSLTAVIFMLSLAPMVWAAALALQARSLFAQLSLSCIVICGFVGGSLAMNSLRYHSSGLIGLGVKFAADLMLGLFVGASLVALAALFLPASSLVKRVSGIACGSIGLHLSMAFDVHASLPTASLGLALGSLLLGSHAPSRAPVLDFVSWVCGAGLAILVVGISPSEFRSDLLEEVVLLAGGFALAGSLLRGVNRVRCRRRRGVA